MYDLPYSKPFLVEEDGPNSPLDHQRVISKLIVGLGILFYREKTIAFEPLPETPLAEGPGHSVPDVSLSDPETEETRIIIEVSRGRGEKNDLWKIVQLIDHNQYGILEGFVYNYRTGEWFRYRKGEGGVATETSFSAVLRLDLGQFL